MKEPSQAEIDHYHELRVYWLSLAVCWLSDEDCQSLGYALSEPNRFVLKVGVLQPEEIKAAKAFQSLPLDRRRYNLNNTYVHNINDARRYQPLMKDCLRGLALTGQQGYTLKKMEEKLADMFQTQYEELKTLADTRLATLGIANAGEKLVEFLWESIVGEKGLPVRNPVVRDSLDLKSNNRFIAFEKLLGLINNPESEQFKHFAKSVILSYLREYKDKFPEKEDFGKDFKDIPDPQAETELNELEQRQELESLLSLITNPKDKKVVELALEYKEKGYNTEEIKADLLEHYDELGLEQRGYYQRLERMREKYPGLKKRVESFKKK